MNTNRLALAVARWSALLSLGLGTVAAQAQLEEVVVTAQKKAESQQDVPVSISAFTGESLSDFQAMDLSSLSGAAPNVQISHFGNTPHGAVFNIRGMGVIEPDPYAGQTVTTVVDGVPLYFNMMSLLDLYDIERIEVLRGPQGTLFGANTTGGVVNVVTRQPTGEFGGDVKLVMGNWNRTDIMGSINLPINDNWSAKITGQKHTRDGFYTNVVDGSTMGDRDFAAVRGYLKYQNDRFDATLIAESTRSRNGSPIVVNGSLPGEVTYQAPGTSPGLGLGGMYQGPCTEQGRRCSAPDRYFSGNSSVRDVSDMDTNSWTLTANWDASFGLLTSITGIKSFDLYEETDQDGGPFFIDDTRRGTEGDQFTQEVRLTIEPNDKSQIIAGVYYQQNDWQHFQNFRIPFNGPIVPGVFGQGNELQQNDWETWSASAFVHGFFDLSDKLRLQVGGRAATEETKARVDYNFFANPDPEGLSVFEGGVPLVQFTELGDESWDGWAAKIGLDYQIDEDKMLYGFVSRGFKSGGFVGRIVIPQDIGPYDQEIVKTAEFGLKSEWLDNRVRFNASYFHNWYDDIQLAVIFFCDDQLGNTNNCNSITNAAEAETSGIELEFMAMPLEGLMLSANYGYLKAEYENFDFFDAATGTTIDLSGRRLQNAPEHTASVSADYTFDVGEGAMTAGLRYTYSGEKYQGNLTNTARGEIQPIKYLDANIKWSPANEAYTVSLWATNLLDDRYIDAIVDAPGFIGLFSYGPPRQAGVSVEYRFD
jgi:iron complex outermembrane receptor protein